MKNLFIYLFLAITCSLLNDNVMAQRNANYDEAKVPDYELPKLLVDQAGQKVVDEKDWLEHRRAEILRLFETSVYGKTPDIPVKVDFKLQKINENALGGMAVLKEILATFKTDKGTAEMNILIYLPKQAKAKVPVFLGLNFYGNHTIQADTSISITQNWVRNSEAYFMQNNQATELSRGIRSVRWPVEEIVKRGYGLATIYCGDLDPDYDDGFRNGIHPLFYKDGQERPLPGEWGTIGAWAWGLSKAMDYFETDRDIDSNKVIVLGHSRLGKAALWAGAQDNRFALVISNDSGCGGAALSRRKIGETVKIINTSFPHWFCGNFHDFNARENELPVDQHMLLALMAPRPLYVASAEDDLWADPKGEFLSLYHAGEVYRLFGYDGLKDMPDLNEPATVGKVGYHIRTGKHDITLYDWERYLDFADQQLKKP